MNEADERLSERIGARFREAADDLDAVTAARLAAGRRRAVAAAGTPRRMVPWLPVAAATAAGILAVAVLWRPVQQPTLPPTDAGAAELLISEPHEMFEDDPDFFLWLDVAALEG